MALRGAGETFADVVKMTTFVTDIAQLPIVREVRGRYLDADRLPGGASDGDSQS